MGNDKKCIDISFFKTFFEPVRFELIEYIFKNPDLSINEISSAFPQDRSVISRHLDALHKKGILIKKKESRFTYYRVDNESVLKNFSLFTEFLNGLMK